MMIPYNQSAEDLRQSLLDEIYAGAFSSLPARLLDEEKIRQADTNELEEISRQYGTR